MVRAASQTWELWESSLSLGETREERRLASRHKAQEVRWMHKRQLGGWGAAGREEEVLWGAAGRDGAEGVRWRHRKQPDKW